MMKLSIKILALCVTVGFALNSTAAIRAFNIQDGLWTNSVNWSGGNTGGLGDQARIYNGFTTELDSSVTINDLLLSGIDATGGHLEINNGATLTANAVNSVYLSGWGGSSSLTLDEGGSLVTAGHISLGARSSAAVLSVMTVNAGTSVNAAGTMFIGIAGSTGNAILSIDGGTVTSGTLSLNDGASVVMANSGTWIINANVVNYYNNNSSKFSGVDSVTWDGSKTTITAIPEPATLGLVTAFGGSLLFIRRHFRM